MSDELINELARAIEHGLAYDVEIDVRASETCIEERRCIAARMLPTIRDYGDKRYRQAIADVVEWLRSENGLCDCFARSATECACGAWDDYKEWLLERTAQEITRRFGKDA